MPPTSDSATRNAWPSRPGSCWTDERLRLAPLLVTGLDCDTTAGGVSCFFLVNGRNAPVGRCFELKRSLELSIEPFACSTLVHSPCPHLSSGDKSFCRKESRNVDRQEICLFLESRNTKKCYCSLRRKNPSFRNTANSKTKFWSNSPTPICE
jgi:hypothetical protein